MSVHTPPLDNVLVRYALNMGTDKKPFCDFLGGGRLPALNIVPPIPGYPAPRNLLVSIDGRNFDVLSFNVEASRALLRKAGHERPLEITWHLPALPESKPLAEMIQQQWLRNVRVRLKLVTREFRVHWEMVQQGAFSGIAVFAFLPLYLDPSPFLDSFTSAASGNTMGWSDAQFTAALASANRTLNPRDRMTKLADCERRVLTAMPCLPQYFDAWEYLRKPFVRGLKTNLFDTRAFKYAWIDTNWRPS